MFKKKLKRAVIKEELVALTGDFIAAVVLNQLIYWSERVYDFDEFIEQEKERLEKYGGPENLEIQIEPTHGWIYKTAEELSAETMLNISRRTMRTYLKELVDAGYIQERTNPRYTWDKTRQYRVNIAKIQTDLKKLGYCLEGYPLETEARNIGSEKSYNRTVKTETSTYVFETAIPEITTEIKKEKTLSKEREKENEQKTQGMQKYGVFKNIFLSDVEIENLKREYPSNYSEVIDKLSAYMAAKKENYENHYAAVVLWLLREKKSNTQNPKNSYDLDSYENETNFLSDWNAKQKQDEESIDYLKGL